MKKFFKRNKEVIRILALIPSAMLIPIYPIDLILLTIQLSCFGIMFWIGWDFEYFD